MRVLLDECVPRGIRPHLRGHVVRSVVSMGWSGVDDGALLVAAHGRFDALITTDVAMARRGDHALRTLAVVLLRGRRTSLQGLAAAIEQLPSAMAGLRPGTVIELGPP